MSGADTSTQSLRAELASVEPAGNCCAASELAALLLKAERHPDQARADFVRVCFPNAALARRVFGLFKFLRSSHTRLRSGDRKSVDLLVPAAALPELIGEPPGWASVLAVAGVRQCCLRAHLRGLMLRSAHMVNPRRSYHLEVVLPVDYPVDLFRNRLEDVDLRLSHRRERPLLYIKGREPISDFLGQLGAVGTMLEFEEIVVTRKMREGINRTVNFEVSNLGRITRAARNQVEAIRYLEESHRLETLPDRLLEVARLRLAHPLDDLATLAGRTQGRLSRSGVFHRLRELVRWIKDQRASDDLANKPAGETPDSAA